MHSNRILGVCDDKGKWFEEQINCPDELFLNKLTKSEADLKVEDITDEEIKEAIFGIGNDKAPGPDGFT
ncbi:RNA-directed DNA polymerase, eukaryota, reverse transcriptase zinc-binding domain protein, partial [Tanacetum coccineum]